MQFVNITYTKPWFILILCSFGIYSRLIIILFVLSWSTAMGQFSKQHPFFRERSKTYYCSDFLNKEHISEFENLGSQLQALRSDIIFYNLTKTKICHFCNSKLIKEHIYGFQIIMNTLLSSFIQVY